VTGIAFLIDLVVTLPVKATGSPVTFSMTSAYCLLVVGVAPSVNSAANRARAGE
jgi:hypothetical protein